MTTTMRRLFLTIALLTAFAMSPVNGNAPDAPEPKRAAAFTLSDQFGRSLEYRFPRSNVSVLTFGDWKGSTQIEGWVRPLWNRYRSSVDINGVAVLDIVPSFARDFARGQFRERVKFPVLLDFEGTVSTAYGFRSDNANILVIAPDGAIALRIVGEATPARLRRVYDTIDRLRGAGAR
jgi:hypothetical protein